MFGIKKKISLFLSLLKVLCVISLVGVISGCVLCGDPLNPSLLCVGTNTASTVKQKAHLGGFPIPNEFSMHADNDQPGQSTSFTGSAFIPMGALQTFDATVRFPPDFDFAPNGFLTNGPAGSVVGNYNVDMNDDGIVDGVFPVKSESVFFAWMDINNDDIKGVFEPDVFQSLDMNGNKLLVFSIPNGGDESSTINTGNVSFHMGVRLDSGLLINPLVPKSHQITATINSVDPDTGGANNGSGISPQQLTLETTLLVNSFFKNGFE